MERNTAFISRIQGWTSGKTFLDDSYTLTHGSESNKVLRITSGESAYPGRHSWCRYWTIEDYNAYKTRTRNDISSKYSIAIESAKSTDNSGHGAFGYRAQLCKLTNFYRVLTVYTYPEECFPRMIAVQFISLPCW